MCTLLERFDEHDGKSKIYVCRQFLIRFSFFFFFFFTGSTGFTTHSVSAKNARNLPEKCQKVLLLIIVFALNQLKNHVSAGPSNLNV